MHVKSIQAMRIDDDVIAGMTFARTLTLLSLPIGYLTSRAWQSGSPLRHT